MTPQTSLLCSLGQHWRRVASHALVLSLALAAAQPATAAETTWYVDIDATGNGSGGSWANAFVSLQDALAKAANGDTIWLAEGVYYPDTGSGQTNNSQNARFAIPAGVKLYGGFDPGVGADAFAERDAAQYPTVLSGDIDGNDTTTKGVVMDASGIKGANSRHVVMLSSQATPITSATVM